MKPILFLSSRVMTHPPSFILGKLYLKLKNLVIWILFKRWSGTKKCYSYDLYFYPLLTLVAPFPEITFIIKCNANNEQNLPSCPFPALMTPFPNKAFINEEATDCINEEAGVAILAPRNPISVFFLFRVLLFH